MTTEYSAHFKPPNNLLESPPPIISKGMCFAGRLSANIPNATRAHSICLVPNATRSHASCFVPNATRPHASFLAPNATRARYEIQE